MLRRPPGSTLTDSLFPYTTLFRSLKPSSCASASRFAPGGTRRHRWLSLALTSVTASFGQTPRQPTSTIPTEALRPFLTPRCLRSALASGLPPCGPKRSEEHTSDLQSLMRFAYAGFRLQKKKTSSIYNLTHSQFIDF